MVIFGTLVHSLSNSKAATKSTLTMSTTARVHPTAFSLSSTIKHHLRPSPHSVVFRSNPNSLAHRRTTITTLTVAMASPLEVSHKSSITVPNKLGDCPFCQRVLLTLEEKHLPYDLKLVDLGNKPEWFLKINPQGKVPLVKLDVQWIADSESWSKIFSTFIGFLKSKDPKDGTEQALINELSTINDYLKLNGPFVNGEKLSSVDFSLAHKLYHLEIALGHFKDWSVPDSLPYLKSYMKIESNFSKANHKCSVLTQLANGGRSTVFDPFSLDIWVPLQHFPLINEWSAARSELGGETAAVANTPIDWKETPEAHVFKVDLPGLKKEEVKLVVEEGKVLQISGDWRVEKDENSDKWHMVERNRGKFWRRFQLPENVKTEELKAAMENGVLTVTVPKQEVDKPHVKVIPIA